MRWLFENPQLLLIIAGAVAYWLNQRRVAKEQAEMEDLARRPPSADEMAERTRRIQEEIRRKIAERQGSAQARPYLEEMARPPEPPPLPSVPAPMMAEDSPGAAELERSLQQQRDYAEAIRRLEESAAAQTKVADGIREGSIGSAPVAPYSAATTAAFAPARSSQWLAGVRGRDALRRAIVLREVLGPPKALS